MGTRQPRLGTIADGLYVTTNDDGLIITTCSLFRHRPGTSDRDSSAQYAVSIGLKLPSLGTRVSVAFRMGEKAIHGKSSVDTKTE